MIPMLAQVPQIAINLMVVGFLLVCLIMILAVLIQKPQGGGLSGAFGSGAGSGQTAFGARTGDALTVATIGIFVLYILAAIGLNFVVRPTTAAPGEVQAVGTSETPAEGDGTAATPPTTGTTAPGVIELKPSAGPPGLVPPASGTPAGSPPAGTPPATEPAGEPATEPAAEPASNPVVPPAEPAADPETPTTPPTTPPANPG